MNILESENIIERRGNEKAYEERHKNLILNNRSYYTGKLYNKLLDVRDNFESACEKYFAAKAELEKLYAVVKDFDGKVLDKRFKDAVQKAGNFNVSFTFGKEHISKGYERYQYTAYLVFPIVVRYPESVETFIRNGNTLTGLSTEVTKAYLADSAKRPRFDAKRSMEMFSIECQKIESKIEEYKHHFSDACIDSVLEASRKIEGETAEYMAKFFGMPKLNINISFPNDIDFLACFTPYGYD